MSPSPGYLLPAAKRRQLTRRSPEVCLEALRDLVGDDYLGPAARTALRCIEEREADPVLMLLVLEAAEEGYWSPPGLNGR